MHLGIRAASVTGMLQKLAAQKPPLVKYEKHHGARLTAAGKCRALEVLRHHRLLERFLHDFLDYPWDEVHEEAERLEHFISERFEQRIAAKLGNPSIDPHGHSIPTLEGEMPKQRSILLSELPTEGEFVIDSISDRDAQTLRLLQASGITPGTRLRVKKPGAGGSYSVRVGRASKAVDLSPKIASEVRILPAGEEGTFCAM